MNLILYIQEIAHLKCFPHAQSDSGWIFMKMHLIIYHIYSENNTKFCRLSKLLFLDSHNSKETNRYVYPVSFFPVVHIKIAIFATKKSTVIVKSHTCFPIDMSYRRNSDAFMSMVFMLCHPRVDMNINERFEMGKRTRERESARWECCDFTSFLSLQMPGNETIYNNLATTNNHCY